MTYKPEVGDLIQLGEDRFGIEEKYGDEFIVTQNDSRSIYILISPITNKPRTFNAFNYRSNWAELLFRPDIGRHTKFGKIAGLDIYRDEIIFAGSSGFVHLGLIEFYRKVVAEIDQNPLISVRIGGTCPECNGKKKVVLFTSIQPCSLCCKKQEQGLPEGVSWI